MAHSEHVEILKQGVDRWNHWREENPRIQPNLSNLIFDYKMRSLSVEGFPGTKARPDLTKINLSGTNLQGVILKHSKLDYSNLIGADFSHANLRGTSFIQAELNHTNFAKANLSISSFFGSIIDSADFSDTNLTKSDFKYAHINNSDLSNSNLTEADFTHTSLLRNSFYGANFKNAYLYWTILRWCNLTNANWEGLVLADAVMVSQSLRDVVGLDTVQHEGPAILDYMTLLINYKNVPNSFLQGCGVSNELIDYLPALAFDPLNFQSCFISFSQNDEEFATKLQDRMREAGLRVWFAPKDMPGGKKLHEEIDNAIILHDRTLIILSESSLNSQWVIHEIRRARRQEVKRGVRKLFPVRLVDMASIQEIECFDSDSATDMWAEIREYYIPDFSNWKDPQIFEREFAKLLKSLRIPQLPTP